MEYQRFLILKKGHLLKFFITLLLLFVVTDFSLFAQEPESHQPFWSHRFNVDNNIAYGADRRQKLDVYTQGNWVGEHTYFRRSIQNRPTLVYFHGGGWVGGSKEGEIGFILPYIERGWNVVNVEYRLGNNTAPNAADDVLLSLKWIAENTDKFNIDPDNIVVSGASAGGHLCLIAGLMNTVPGSHPYYVGDKLKIRAIINWFGITEIEILGKYLKDKNWNYVLEWVGSEEKIPEISKKYSPLYYVTPNAPAVLTIHGSDDSIVPHSQARLLHESLQKSGVKNQLLTLSGGKHMGFNEEQFQLIYRTIFSFLDEVME